MHENTYIYIIYYYGGLSIKNNILMGFIKMSSYIL